MSPSGKRVVPWKSSPSFDMLQTPGWEKEGVGGQGWRMGTGSPFGLGGRGPSYVASVCAVSAPNVLLADNSESPFLESYRTTQPSLWEVLTHDSWCQGLLFHTQEHTWPPTAACLCGARIASPLCAVQGTRLGKAIALIWKENKEASPSSFLPSWLKERLCAWLCAEAASPFALDSLCHVVGPVGLPPGLCAVCPRPDQTCFHAPGHQGDVYPDWPQGDAMQ